MKPFKVGDRVYNYDRPTTRLGTVKQVAENSTHPVLVVWDDDTVSIFTSKGQEDKDGARVLFHDKTPTQEKTGNKLDSQKPKISLIPAEAIEEMAIAFTYGAKKYEADNFKLGIAYRRLLDATFRHLFAVSRGEDIDAESGNSHLGHAMASIAMLIWMQKHKPELDDRYKEQK